MADELETGNGSGYMGVDEEDTDPSGGNPDTGDQKQEVIQIRRSELAQEFRRWQKEDAEAANVFNSFIGEKAAFKYQPEIERRDDEIFQLRRELRRRDIEAMSQEQFDALFNASQDFRHEVADLHNSDPRQIELQVQYRTLKRQCDYTLNSAIDDGLPREVAEQLRKDLSEGKFDRSEEGNALSPQESLTLLERATRRALVESIRNSGSSAGTSTPDSAKPPRNQQTPQGNQNLARMQTDIGTQGRVAARSGPQTMAQYRESLKAGNKPLSSDEVDRLVRQEYNL